MKKTFFEIVIKDNLEMFARSLLDMKILAAVPIITLFIEGFKEYVFSDFQFLFYLIVLIGFDTVTKIWALYKKQERISLSEFLRKNFDKSLKYSAILSISHVLDTFKTNGVENELFGWVGTSLYVLLLVIEVKSIFDNIGFGVGGKLKEVFETISKFGNFSEEEKKEPPINKLDDGGDVDTGGGGN